MPISKLSITLSFLMIYASTSVLLAQDRNYSDCVVKERAVWGAVCADCEYYRDAYKRSYEETFTLELKNVCPESVEVKVAMQEKNGKWRTFPVKVIAQNEVFEAYACKGSGKYLYWVRRLDDNEIILPTDREILSEYQEHEP